MNEGQGKEILRPPRDSGAIRAKEESHRPRLSRLIYKGEHWALRVEGVCLESQNKSVLEPKPETMSALALYMEISMLSLSL